MGQYLALDLGAESGRAILGGLFDGKVAVDELHRFPNTPLREEGGLHWDIWKLWHEVRRGVEIAVSERRVALDGIGVDTWGVDFALLGEDGTLVEKPRHYRDSRNNGVMEKVFAAVPRDEVFGYTGIQMMQINSLNQLYAMKLGAPDTLARARKLLHIPDLFNRWFTGVAQSEATIASTSQFFNPTSMAWATELFKRLDLPGEILCPIVKPGTLLGPTLEPPHVSVYAIGGHDTASAVAAVPASEDKQWCYISSGTWSLMGVELDAPVINADSLRLNYTNEVGVGGKIRLLKNIAGLWLLQECKRAWSLEGAEYTYDELTKMAAAARPFSAQLDPDAFLEPGEMPRKIAEHCRARNGGSPGTHGEFVRAILESLALRYRQVLDDLETISGRRIEVIHIVGGGSRNGVLNQFVADCTGRVVIAGPSEATALGNILTQAMGAGELGGLDDIRAVVRASCAPVVFDPRPSAEWDQAYAKFARF
jgi:rhamnulokinase